MEITKTLKLNFLLFMLITLIQLIPSEIKAQVKSYTDKSEAQLFTEEEINKLQENNIDFSYASQFKKFDPQLTIENLIHLSKGQTSILYANNFKKLIPNGTIDDLINFSNNKIDIIQAVVLKFYYPNITIHDFIELSKNGINLSEAGEFLKIFPEESIKSVINLNEKKVNIFKAALFKFQFPKVTVEDLIKLSQSQVEISDAIEIMRSTLLENIEDLIKLIENNLDKSGTAKFKKADPKVSMEDLIKLHEKQINLYDAAQFKKAFPQVSIDDLIKLSEVPIDFKLAAKLKKKAFKVTIANLITLAKNNINLEEVIADKDKLKHYLDLNKIKNQQNTFAIVGPSLSNHDFTKDKSCYKSVKDLTLNVLESVWPLISSGKKNMILKNTHCNNFIRNYENQFRGFKILPQTAVGVHLDDYIKKLPEYFLEICQNEITEENYYDQLQKSVRNPYYGPLFASDLNQSSAVKKDCPQLIVTLEKRENTLPFFIPESNELPKNFNEVSIGIDLSSREYPHIREVTSKNYKELFSQYRSGTLPSSKRDGLTREMSTLPPFKDPKENTKKKDQDDQNDQNDQDDQDDQDDQEDQYVWRKADLSFDGIPLSELKPQQISCEKAPTCTSTNNPVQWEQSHFIKIKIPTEYNLSRLVKHISKFEFESEVLFPPDSCFRFLETKLEIPPKESKKQTVYYFELVPWTADPHYGYFSREQAIREANKYYGRDYPQVSDARNIGGKIVKRPNHGLTHGARQAYLILDLLHHLAEDNGRYGDLGHWAREIRGDFKKKDILFLLGLHFRAARLQETENHFPEYVEHIKKILKKSQRVNDNHEIESYANLLSEKPDDSSQDKKFAMMVLDVAHRNDHLRQSFWKVDQSEKDQKYAIGHLGNQNEENQNNIIEFMQERAALYLKATGVYNKKVGGPYKSVGEYAYSNPKLFARLENNPKELFQVLEKITLDKAK